MDARNRESLGDKIWLDFRHLLLLMPRVSDSVMILGHFEPRGVRLFGVSEWHIVKILHEESGSAVLQFLVEVKLLRKRIIFTYLDL